MVLIDDHGDSTESENDCNVCNKGTQIIFDIS